MLGQSILDWFSRGRFIYNAENNVIIKDFFLSQALF